MTEVNYKKQAQEYYANAPVIILGSGASVAFGLPSMAELADYIRSNIDADIIPRDQSGNWLEFCGLLETGVDLEAALHQVNFSPDITNIIVRSAWQLINNRDELVYKNALLDRSLFPLERLLKHMFRTSLNKLDVLTTNYDCLAEYACDQGEIHYYNGFSSGHIKRLSLPDYIKCVRTVNIWKVHGSIDWFYSESGDNISISKPEYVPDEYEPQIVTPGVQKYKRTHLEPFRTIISSADKALERASSYFCFGFGFNDEHIQPKLLTKCERDNASITVATHTLTNQAHELLFSGKIKNFLAIERGENNGQSKIYSSLCDEPILVNEDYWSMDGFLNLIM
ncbi:MAG: SIR2 family protein [Alphaproteobacteria bacterium]